MKNKKTNIEKSIDKNMQRTMMLFSHVYDIKTRTLLFNNKRLCVVYIETIANKDIINERIIKVICELRKGNILTDIPVSDITLTNHFEEIETALASGNAVLFLDSEQEAYIVGTNQFQPRNFSEPSAERTILGSHDGFGESLNLNISAIRNRIRSSNLKIEIIPVGEEVTTNVGIVYLENVANEEIVRKVKERVDSIRIDSGLTSGKIEEFIEDSSYSPFPQILKTERPDRVVANIVEGRIAVLTEGDASVSIMPVSFFSYYQSPDDFDVRPLISSFLRIIRIIAFFFSVTLPALYIAIVSFNYEIIPYDLLQALKGSVDYIPFPPIIEAIIMQLILELLREASIRLPSSISQTIGVVGGLVIGTAIVQANLVSNPMVVIVALTAISSFVIPIHEMSFSLRILSFPMIVAASVFGIVGIAFGWVYIFMHLIKLESVGAPYFSPIAPIRLNELKDTLIRIPIWKMNTVPSTSNSPKKTLSNWKKEWKNNE